MKPVMTVFFLILILGRIRVIILRLIFAFFDSPKLSGVFIVYDANAFDSSLDCFSEVHLEIVWFFYSAGVFFFCSSHICKYKY